MKPARFEYADPATVEDAVEILARGDAEGEARVLAGGQSLMPLLNMRLSRPSLLVDINRVAALDYIHAENGRVRIGALTRLADLHEWALSTAACPLLKLAIPHIGHPPIRLRSTVGGCLAHADPAAELPAVMLALDASFVVRGGGGSRELRADEFYLGPFTTAMAPGELLVEVGFAAPRGVGMGFQEIARRHGDFALVGVAATVKVEQERVADVRLAVFGVGSRPMRLIATETALKGSVVGDQLYQGAAAAAQAEVAPQDDIHASAEYRTQVTGVLTARALRDAVEQLDKTAGGR